MRFDLNTTRLNLRHFHLDDANRLYEIIFSDSEVMRFGDGPRSRAYTRSWIQICQQDYKKRRFGVYAVLENTTRLLIGYCGLFYFPDVNGKPEVEIGYRLARSAWGKGYATEAAIVVRDYAVNTLGIKRLIAIIDPYNTASIRVAIKLGMKYEQDVSFESYTHPDHVYVVTST